MPQHIRVLSENRVPVFSGLSSFFLLKRSCMSAVYPIFRHTQISQCWLLTQICIIYIYIIDTFLYIYRSISKVIFIFIVYIHIHIYVDIYIYIHNINIYVYILYIYTHNIMICPWQSSSFHCQAAGGSGSTGATGAVGGSYGAGYGSGKP